MSRPAAMPDDLEDRLRHPRHRAAWVTLLLGIVAWAAWAWLALGEDARAGLSGSERWVRLAGWLAPYGLGLLAIHLRADGLGAMGEALRRAYFLQLAPLVGLVAGLAATFSALGGRFGGGTTVYDSGARVVHHEVLHDRPARDRLFGALLFGVTTVAAGLAWYLAFRALGVDVVAEIASDFV